MNVLDETSVIELEEIVKQTSADAAVKGVVITSGKEALCAGADLSEFDFSPGPGLVERADPGPLIDQAFNPTARRLLA